MAASAVILGASGYAGGEVLRVLAAHPAVAVVGAAADTRAGEPVAGVLPSLAGRLDLELRPMEEVLDAGEVCFSCLPSGRLSTILDSIGAEIVVDLSDDFRSHPGWLYALPELDRSRHAKARRIANPGCYPTAALLCLVPFARAGLISGPVVVDALSGFSGAGRAPYDHLLFANATGGAAAYGSVTHRHVPEMERGLVAFGRLATTISFTPHLVPMARGLLVTARAALLDDLTDDSAYDILCDAYVSEPFVHVMREWPSTKGVAGTNHAHVSARVDPNSGYLVCSAAIDNLGKGAAGQAVQNVNLALGLDETTGLGGVAVWP